MTVTVIGLGLIGGSIALELKANGFCEKIIGIEQNPNHAEEALSLKIVDEVLTLEEAIPLSDLIILAIPVNKAPRLLEDILTKLNSNQVIIDVGSTKSGICAIAENHRQRACFVATHPIAGTEKSGPSAAHLGLFHHKINIICEKEKSAPQALVLVESLYDMLHMKTIYMDPKEHDKHIAYVSHLSHISSFTLGLTVLEIEENEKNIFNMAGSGFESTVRLAKSSPDMWSPIFQQNRENVSAALGKYIDQLVQFKEYLDGGDTEKTYALMIKANEIRRVLDGITLKSKIITNNKV